MLQYEDAARSLWADRAFNDLASIRRLELVTFVAALVAVRMILIVDGYFGDFWLRVSLVWRCAEDSGSSNNPAQ